MRRRWATGTAAHADRVNYAEKVLAVVDGLPKFKDFPCELGGSDERLAE
jgi:hypothetical protein